MNYAPASPPIIASRANPLARKLLALADARGIRKHGCYLVGGKKLVTEALAQYPAKIAAVIDEAAAHSEIQDLPKIPVYRLARSLFNEVNVFGAPPPLLLMRLPELPSFEPKADWPNGCTLFVPFGDPENVGSVIRSAAALGAARVVLTAEAAMPFLPRALRASAGAVWRIPLLRAPALADISLPAEREIFVLDAGGRPLDAWPVPRGAYGLIAGQEGQGLPAALRAHPSRLALPMRRGVESLNAAVAVAILLWCWRQGL